VRTTGNIQVVGQVEEKVMFSQLKPVVLLLAAASLIALPAAAASNAIPGTLNYVEGQVSVNGRTVTSKSVGAVNVEPGQSVDTSQGRAEILLTPGVFVRLGDASSLRMISPNLEDTRVQLLRGEAIVEATQIFKDNNIQIELGNSTTKLTKEGLFDFNANSGLVRVFDGKAVVREEDQQVKLKKGREIALAGPFKAGHFDAKTAAGSDQLYAFSNLRSEYLAQASIQSAQNIYGAGALWGGSGWYWNPWWDMYSFIPGDGIWFSPFGWPYFSPWMVYAAPYYGFGYYGGYGYYGRGFVGHHAILPTTGLRSRGFGAGHINGGFARGGFGGRGFVGHGFAGGAVAGRGFGGFHGGGFGGGMRGGFAGGRR